ncbi:hypothetical protein KY289_037560 [Solanum tuberosum]|nr:hypothetical protein KY289_037560 [Solanum tuberosum]
MLDPSQIQCYLDREVVVMQKDLIFIGRGEVRTYSATAAVRIEKEQVHLFTDAVWVDGSYISRLRKCRIWVTCACISLDVFKLFELAIRV